MSYFSMFPTTGYDYYRDGIIQNAVGIYKSVRPLQNYIDDMSGYNFYEIKNGERPDVTSQRLYGTPNYYWTFFIINEFLHDGIGVWPMSQEDLTEYINNEYNGYAIETRPDLLRNSDAQIIEYTDSLAGRFTMGETITGGISGASGTLTKKDIYLNQLIVQNVSGGAFLGNGSGNVGGLEDVTGTTSLDSVLSFMAYKYASAPHHYYRTDDPTQAQVSPTVFFSQSDDAPTNNVINVGSTSTAELSYTTNRQHIHALNDERSKIRVLDGAMISKFVSTFESLINA